MGSSADVREFSREKPWSHHYVNGFTLSVEVILMLRVLIGVYGIRKERKEFI